MMMIPQTSIRYTLRYSPDGGINWHVIALDIAEDNYTLPSIDHLPGSTTAGGLL